jgi:hypothetical protein
MKAKRRNMISKAVLFIFVGIILRTKIEIIAK